MPTTVFDFIDFVAFIVPRCLQLLLGMLTQLGWMGDAFALSMYFGLSYLCAAGLAGGSLWLASKSVHGRVLVINTDTATFLMKAFLLCALAVFTAAAPTTGLSMKYCARAAAEFVRFSSPHY